jgi:hypothetical protein
MQKTRNSNDELKNMGDELKKRNAKIDESAANLQGNANGPSLKNTVSICSKNTVLSVRKISVGAST